jgi:hypothetical protein
MVGVGARADILRKLGESLLNLKDIFGPTGRPGNLVGKLEWPATSTSCTELTPCQTT